MIRRTALLIAIAAAIVLAGCNARDTAGLSGGSYVDGGYGTPFYAEVVHADKEGAKPRVYIFGTIAAFDEFVKSKQVDELGHKKFINRGRNRETLVVQTLKGQAAKDDPKFTDRLVETYLARLPMPVTAAAQ